MVVLVRLPDFPDSNCRLPFTYSFITYLISLANLIPRAQPMRSPDSQHTVVEITTRFLSSSFFSKERGNAEILVKWLRVHVAVLTKSTV